jgi:hypothetical protein
MTKFVERKALIVNLNPLYKCTLLMGVQVFGGFRSISIPLNCFVMKLGILQTESRYVCLYCFFQPWICLTAHTWDANKMTQSFVYCRFFKLLWLNYYCALELTFLTQFLHLQGLVKAECPTLQVLEPSELHGQLWSQ